MTDSRKYSGCLFSIHIYTFKFFEANKTKNNNENLGRKILGFIFEKMNYDRFKIIF